MPSQHTPGPWVVQANATSNKAARYDILHGIQGVANICGGISAEAEANARLIAAAPEMAETLDGLGELVDLLEGEHFTTAEFIAKARALLARMGG